MKYFGLHWHSGKDFKDPNHISHDSAVTIFNDDGSLHFHGQLERYSRIKRDASHFDKIYNFFPNLCRPTKDDIVACVNSTSKPICQNFPYEVLYVDHHLAHACASWCFRSDDKQRIFLAYDGYGRGVNGELNHSLIGKISDREYILEKWNTIPSSIHLGKPLGIFNVGKLMGLAGCYPDVQEVKEINFDHRSSLTLENKKAAAGFYRYHINQIWKSIEPILTGPVIIGGGSTLALELNSRIYQKTQDVVFAPCADDSGISLGCAAYAFFSKNGYWPRAFTNAAIIRQSKPYEFCGPQKIQEIVNLLSEGKICGLMRGNSECGPRSLGQRSILGSARSLEMKELISEKIKGRESYRPLAPIVTDREFSRFFTGPSGKYMQYMTSCTETARKLIPAVVHVDNTSRPQVVSEDDPWLYELLVEYGKKTGVECLINTSLNTGGRPIAENMKQAKDDLRGHDVILSVLGKSFYI